MTETVITSEKQKVVLGFERRFVMIGERINPDRPQAPRRGDGAGRLFARRRRRRSRRSRPARRCSTSMPESRLPTSRRSSPSASSSCRTPSPVPLSIDSSIVEALEAGLAAYKGKPLVNSVTGEEERLERVLPLIKKYGAAVVAISNDETGISEDPDVRFEVAKKIVERAADYGIRARGHRRRPPGHAGRRHQRCRPQADAPPAPPADRAEGQHDLRRVELLLRPAEPARV